MESIQTAFYIVGTIFFAAGTVTCVFTLLRMSVAMTKLNNNLVDIAGEILQEVRKHC